MYMMQTIFYVLEKQVYYIYVISKCKTQSYPVLNEAACHEDIFHMHYMHTHICNK